MNALEVAAAMIVSDPSDRAAVLLKTGRAAIGMSIAEARFISLRLARAADEVEYQLSQRDSVTARGRDAREFFESEQCPSDASFR